MIKTTRLIGWTRLVMGASLFAACPLVACQSAGVASGGETTRAREEAPLERTPSAEPTQGLASLGSEPDGEVSEVSPGVLRIDRALRARFDYHLSDASERDWANGLVETRVRLLAGANMSGETQQRLAATFDAYVRYLEAGQNEPALEGAAPSARLARVMDLRRELLGDEIADAFFADEERIDAVFARRAEAPASARQSPDEQEREMEATLPDDAQRARQDASLFARAFAEEQALRQAGRAGEIPALRERLLGAAAAERLAALDRARGR